MKYYIFNRPSCKQPRRFESTDSLPTALSRLEELHKARECGCCWPFVVTNTHQPSRCAWINSDGHIVWTDSHPERDQMAA